MQTPSHLSLAPTVGKSRACTDDALVRNITLITGASLTLVVVLPLILGQGGALTVACQIGVWIVFALAYNICLGQAGLLSFCHALFFGVGSYAAAHAISATSAGQLPNIPVWLMPIVGFMAGGAFGALLAAFLCRRVGVAFVMITLGLSQLVIYLASSLDSVFGGEGGVAIDRAYGGSFSTQIEVYWLIAVWMMTSVFVIWLISRTAFGKLSRAVRENEERVRFLGQDVVRVRFLAITLSAAFAGLAGALQVINIEQVSQHVLSLKTSAFVLFMVVIGGARSFFGPVVGAVLISLLDKVLPDHTGAWLLYLGLAFCAVILRTPSGIMGAIEQRWRLVTSGRLAGATLAFQDLLRLTGLLLLMVGLVMVVEMASAMSSGANFYEVAELTLMGLKINPHSLGPWLFAAVAGVSGWFALSRISDLPKA